MDDEFGLLVAGNVPRNVYCLLLGVMHRGRPFVASALYCPAVLVRYNMLIFACHDGSPSVELSKSQPFGWVVNDCPVLHNQLLTQTTGRSSQSNLKQA